MRARLLCCLVAALLAGSAALARPGAVGAAATPYRFELGPPDVFVSQANLEQCVAASIQMMLQLMDRPVELGPAAQRHYWELARDLSHSPFGGANPRGWAHALNALGAGPYELRLDRSYERTLRLAAIALRRTGRPVGLVVWRGAHAWVMTGFGATADPAQTIAAQVTHVTVLDPFHPRRSTLWGPASPPNGRLTPAQLAEDFVPWKRGRVNPILDGRYLLILPVESLAPAPGPRRS